MHKASYLDHWFGQRGGEGDHVDGGTSRFDTRGAIYQALCANCGGNQICPPRGRLPGDPIRAPMIVWRAVISNQWGFSKRWRGWVQSRCSKNSVLILMA